MSGHSKWAKTHRKKEVADAKRGAIFTKFGNAITLAAKQGGSDLDSNFSLRLIVEKARAANMPKDNIDKAIKRGTGEGGNGAVLEEATYEAFGPRGTTFIIETITDNKNRTITDVKIAVSKNGGQMGGANSVAWMFERKGSITIDPQNKNQDELELSVIDAGAEDIDKHAEDEWEIFTAADQLQNVITHLKDSGIAISESSLTYRAKEEIPITDEGTKERIERIYSALDDLDDVNNIYTNATW